MNAYIVVVAHAKRGAELMIIMTVNKAAVSSGMSLECRHGHITDWSVSPSACLLSCLPTAE